MRERNIVWCWWTCGPNGFPTSKQDAAAVAKALLTEIVPRWGIPQKISSDNGTHQLLKMMVYSDDMFLDMCDEKNQR